MKIALVGPASPYRGGIAHHTNMLYAALRHRHEVDVITFERQYPQCLYPGATQVEARDTEIPSERMIDSVNPLNWMKVGRTIRERGYDLCIFRCWQPFFGPCFGTIAGLHHRRGERDTLVIVDNIIPHEHHCGDELLTRFFINRCSMAITQSGAVRAQFGEMFPKIPQATLPLPVFKCFGAPLPKAQSRSRLGIPMDKKVILFFGFIRHYKGLDRIIAAMPELTRRMPDLHLLIVGEFLEDPRPYAHLIRKCGAARNITLHSEYVPNGSVPEWFSAADLLVLPYRSATNSGIVQIAYNFSLPPLVTNVGNLAEVVVHGKTGWVVEDASPDSLASEVEGLYRGDLLRRLSDGIESERKKYCWEAFVNGLEEFVGEVRQGRWMVRV